VTTAPVVKSKIGGGHISITLGSGERGDQLEAAEKLARGLMGR
jgi:hypothetical protein